MNCTFRSKVIPEAIVHFVHPIWILWFISSSTSPLFCMMNSRFLNHKTFQISSPIFISKLELVLLMLNLYFIYFILRYLNESHILMRFNFIMLINMDSLIISPTFTLALWTKLISIAKASLKGGFNWFTMFFLLNSWFLIGKMYHFHWRILL